MASFANLLQHNIIKTSLFFHYQIFKTWKSKSKHNKNFFVFDSFKALLQKSSSASFWKFLNFSRSSSICLLHLHPLRRFGFWFKFLSKRKKNVNLFSFVFSNNRNSFLRLEEEKATFLFVFWTLNQLDTSGQFFSTFFANMQNPFVYNKFDGGPLGLTDLTQTNPA